MTDYTAIDGSGELVVKLDALTEEVIKRIRKREREETLREVEGKLTAYGEAFKESKQGDITHEWVIRACIERVVAMRRNSEATQTGGGA